MTFHVIVPEPDGVAAVTAVPVVAGWLVHVTPPSVQAALTRRAWIVRPPTGDPLCTRSSAPTIWQPAGTAGSAKRTRPRECSPLLARTLSTESDP